MNAEIQRRDFLRVAGAACLAPLADSTARAAAAAPTAPVSIARCDAYDPDRLVRALGTMMDQLGGLAPLVRGKTVAVKVNLTGHPTIKALGLSAARTFQVHPNVVMAFATLLDRAGAKRIRFLEGTYQRGPFEALLGLAGWDLKALASLRAPVEYEDTRNLGRGTHYHTVKVPWGGSLFPAYELNHSYVDCDVYVSLAKLKNHATAGVTLAMKNNFGITPTAFYAHHTHDEQTADPRMAVLHTGAERPADGVPQELDPKSPRRPSYRVPRHTIDAVGIRPIDLALIDGVETISGAEGPWLPDVAIQRPGLLLAGRNAVCTDAIATAVMGYDPMARAATGPFPGDNHLALASEAGLGTNDPARIEVLGLSVKAARHPFGWEPRQRNT